VADQLKKIYIAGELDVLETPQWYARLARKDYTIGLNVTGVSVDDPDGNIVENYSCKSERNYTQYCNAEVDRLLAAQSRELDKEKRKKIVWDIERLLVDDAARPIIISSVAANCWQPYVRNYTPHDNSQYNSLRFEEVCWISRGGWLTCLPYPSPSWGGWPAAGRSGGGSLSAFRMLSMTPVRLASISEFQNRRTLKPCDCKNASRS
jgi:hypothetical protein